MWLFPWLSNAAIGGMALVLIAMARSEEHRTEFVTSAISVAVALGAYFIKSRLTKKPPTSGVERPPAGTTSSGRTHA